MSAATPAREVQAADYKVADLSEATVRFGRKEMELALSTRCPA